MGMANFKKEISVKFITRAFPILLTIFLITPTLACTVVMNANDPRAVVVGRNMDWMAQMPTTWFVYPEGILRDGSTDNNPIKWTSKYGSVVTNSYDIATDGFNEKGLSAHLLWLNEADYGNRDASQPGLSVTMWVQYYLDNFQSVDEAVKFTQANAFQLVAFLQPDSQRWLKLHLAIEDATGDSAIIEYTDGTPHIYHDRANTVMTNGPTYDQQLLNIKQYKPFGGNNPLPGTMNSPDRFVRAMYFNSMLRKSTSLQQEIAAELSVLQSTSQPFLAPNDQNPNGAWTEWHTISDLTDKIYYYQSTLSLDLISMSLSKFDMRPDSPIYKLSLDDNANLVGDVSDEFVEVSAKSSKFDHLKHVKLH